MSHFALKKNVVSSRRLNLVSTSNLLQALQEFWSSKQGVLNKEMNRDHIINLITQETFVS